MIQGLAAAMLVCLRWILLFTPVGVFVFTFLFALGTGGEAVGVLGAWVIIVSGLLLLCTVLLYPVTGLLGPTTVRALPARWLRRSWSESAPGPPSPPSRPCSREA
jgi:Na+/H+-dicarboxylate symporter